MELEANGSMDLIIGTTNNFELWAFFFPFARDPSPPRAPHPLSLLVNACVLPPSPPPFP